MDISQSSNHYDLAFLADYARDQARIPDTAEMAVTRLIKEKLRQADEIFIALGGKARRLGESIVGTGLLESFLLALKFLAKQQTPIRLLLDPNVAALFYVQDYQMQHMLNISFTITAQPDEIRADLIANPQDKHIIWLDFHGAHDGLPYLEVTSYSRLDVDGIARQIGELSTLGHLFRVGIREYAEHGPERRYADFIEDLFALPRGSLAGQKAQPRLLLSADDSARYLQLLKHWQLYPQAWQIVCFFQSVVPAKCYELWDEVMQLFCADVAIQWPGQRIDFLLACGPDRDAPPGFNQADLAEWLGDFTGTGENAHVTIASIPDLRDLAILLQQSLMVLANDTGPGHIAGALGVPTIVPFLPGRLYSRPVWSSTLWHQGVTLEPNPYTYQQLERAIIWGKREIINSIPPMQLYQVMLQCLQRVLDHKS